MSTAASNSTALNLQHIAKEFPHPTAPVRVFEDLNLEVNKGEIAAIIGPSGSGKSTLLSLMAGLDRPSSGSILAMGEDLSKMDESGLNRYRATHLGIVFQQFHLMKHLTAEENVLLPLRIRHQLKANDSSTSQKSYSERAQEALDAVGLGHRTDHFPHELSGGECQRVAMARAMVGRPALLLADEPSGNLDRNTGDKVMDLLFQIVEEQGLTLVLVTHNEPLAKRCHRVLTLSQGKLIEADA